MVEGLSLVSPGRLQCAHDRDESIVKVVFRTLAAAWLSVGAMSCTSEAPEINVGALLDSYREANAAADQLEAELSTRARDFGIQVRRADGQVLVSAEYAGADATELVQGILDASQTEYIQSASLTGPAVTGRFRDAPLREVLALIVDGQGVRVDWHNDSVVITARPEADNGYPVEYPLTSIDVTEAGQVLEEMFEVERDSGDLSFASSRATNVILLNGDPESVGSALSVLRLLDQPAHHVFIEAVIVEFNSERLTDFGAQLSNGSRGHLSSAFFDVANAVGSNLGFAYNSNSAMSLQDTSFSLALDFLEQTDVARVLSRPFISTVSGRSATLEITEDRFVETIIDDEAELNEVSSGISVEVTPTVTAQSDILMHFTVTESRFAATEEDETLRRSRNSVESTAQISSGRTVVIGGLSLKTRASTSAGLPGAGTLPPLSAVFGHEATRDQDTEVMVFLTPRIWRPGMDIPVSVEEDIRRHEQGDLATDAAGQD